MSVIARRSVFATLASLCALAGALMCWGASARAALVHPYLSQLTEVPASSGAAVTGPFGHPWGLALGAGGELYVADNTSRVVDEFDSSGSFVSPQIGGGILSEQYGRNVAVNHATGEVYVADSEQDVVYAFSAAGVLLETWRGADTPNGSFGGGFVHVAMDNSTSLSDPMAGEVYVSDSSQHKVVDVLKPEAGGKEKYLTQLTGVGAPSGFSSPFELAVNEANGELLVANRSEQMVDVFMPVMGGYEYVRQLTGPPGGPFGEIGGIAVEASSGEIYVADTGAKVVDQFSATGVFEGQIGGPAGGAFAEPLGVAVTEGGDVYVADGSAKAVDVFGPRVVVPDVAVGSVSGETATSATLSGTVDPAGVTVSSCRFEYGASTAYGQSVPCAQTPAQIGAGNGPVPVGATLTGLLANTTYHFRLDGGNANGTNFTRDATFTTAGTPAVDGESFANVGTIAADVSAQVNPDGRATTYQYEYGTSIAYGSTTSPVSLGAGTSDAGAPAELGGLQPDTVYHVRVTVSNEYGSVHGGDITFTTFPLVSSGLPDGRVYEPVSQITTEGNANAYVPKAGSNWTDIGGQFGGIATTRPFEVAASGEDIVYPGDPAHTGGDGSTGYGNGETYFARRSPDGGWTTVDLQPASVNTIYEAFSSDLSIGIVASDQPLASGAPEADLYAHPTVDGAGGQFDPLSTVTSAGIDRGRFFFAGGNAGGNGTPSFRHLIFQSELALIEGDGSLQGELREAVAKDNEEGVKPKVLYDSVAGHPSLVNVLPDGSTDANASFGFPSTVSVGGGAAEGLDLSRAISADGNRIFWTDSTTGNMYVREDGGLPNAKTVQVDAAEAGCSSCVAGGGRFWAASGDGSSVLFTAENKLTSDSTAESVEPDLYEYDVSSGTTTDLTVAKAGSHANVKGVLGSSEDGSYVYFVAGGVLASNENGRGERATTGICEEGEEPAEKEEEENGLIPAGRGCNLYLLHSGEPAKFIAALPALDDTHVVPFDDKAEGNTSGDWQGASGFRTTEVTPDGHSLLFMSRRSLTGYGTELNAVSRGTQFKTFFDEVFLYEAGTGVLHCVSCNSSGEAPVRTAFEAPGSLAESLTNSIGGFFPITKSLEYRAQPRVISDDGSRVFFDSEEPLVPQDTNGWMDVYEWERDGAGSCRKSQGCVYLLSGGTDLESSWLLGASGSGDDVFIITRAQLVAGDRNDNDDVYDARVGGVEPPIPSQCAGSGCQGVPPAPPIFATPASATFAGVGNFAPPQPVAHGRKSTKKKAVKCAKGQRLTHGKCARGKSHKGKKSRAGRADKNRGVR
jgi:hypothetical protein